MIFSGNCAVLISCLLCLCVNASAQYQNALLNEADTLNSRAIEHYNSGDYTNALPLYERALAIREKALGPQHADTATSLNNLASLYRAMGDYAKALPLYERALAIREKALGPQHTHTATSLNNLASLYRAMGDYAKALPLCERALAIREKALGPQHVDTATSLNNLAGLYRDMGDYAKALPLYERALAIREKALGPQHTHTATSLSNLASLYRAMGDYAKALPLCERALAIREKALGPQHVDTATSLNNLAVLYRDMGDYAKALPLYERALAIHEKAFGPQHTRTATSLSNLADLYRAMGDYAKALPLCERALAIYEKALGPQHADTATSLNNLAGLYRAMGDYAMARAFSSRRTSSIHYQLQRVLGMNERFRLTWQAKNLVYSLEPCVLRPEQMGQLVLRWKGIVLDSLIEDQAMASAASGDSEGRKTLEEIQNLRASMSKLAFSEKQADRDQSEQIAKRIADLERSLASRTTILGRVRQSADITLDAVLPALTIGTVLLDFFQYRDAKLKGAAARSYGALLLAEDGQPKIVLIAGAAAIDQAVAACRAAVTKGDESALDSGLKTLTEKLWQPIADQLPPSTKQLLVGPDGALNFLSFATLRDASGRFLGEKYQIAYVGTGRDLAKPTAKRQSKSLVVFANPDFEQSGFKPATNRFAMRAAEVTAFGEIRLPQLPGTQAEGAALSEAARKAGWNSSNHFGSDATEQQIRALKKPDILHLATHGFYLNTITPTGDGERGMKVTSLDEDRPRPANANGVDPMRASGIALSGAQATLKSWGEGKAPDPQNDGILTAEEVAGLDLNGTWLVTLSACETGVGEAKSGEGVFGLRRAFMTAGAENLLMTLWPVADDTTAKIMADFYKEALATGDAPGSLAKVQRHWLVKLRDEKGLAAAIREAGPFAMVMMTAPTHPPVELPPIAKLESKSESATQPAEGSTAEKKSGWWPF